MPAADPNTQDLALLAEAARGAGRIAARHFRQRPKIWDKGDGQGPVTEADLEVNDFLLARLQAARPDYGWLSEESDPLNATARLETAATFVIDPIDGTRAFIDGQPGFAHALAVVRGGVPVAAAVFLPMLDLMYAARLGGGASLNGDPIRATDPTDPGQACVLAARPAFEARHWPQGVPPVRRQFRPSLAWRLALVAQGRFDGMLTLRDVWDWDIAASTLIATEAGALVTNRCGGGLRFNGAGAKNPGVVAAGQGLHKVLVGGLNPRPDLPVQGAGQ